MVQGGGENPRSPGASDIAALSFACSAGRLWWWRPGRGAPTRRRLRVIVLGQTADHAAADLSGQNRQRRRGHPLPGRGPRDRVPGDGRWRRGAVRGPLRRRDRRLVDHPGAGRRAPRPRRPATRSPTSTTSSAGPRRPGSGCRAGSKNSDPPKFTLVRQSPLQILNSYFGGKVDLRPRAPADRVLRGQTSRSSIPTWAPMFAFNVSGENTWRGSGLPDHCVSNRADIQGGHPQQGVGKTKVYGCYYSEGPPALHGDARQKASFL